MKRSTLLNLKRIGILDFLNHNKILLLMCLFFVIGFIVGTFTYSGNENISALAQENFSDYLIEREGKKFFAVFASSALNLIIVMLCFFISGTSMLGMVLVPFLVAARGLYYGSLSALLYAEHALKGVAFNAIILIPPALIFAICMFFAARESLNFSLLLSRLTLPKSLPANISNDFKNYSGRYLLLFLAVFLAALIDAALSTTFLHFFEF